MRARSEEHRACGCLAAPFPHRRGWCTRGGVWPRWAHAEPPDPDKPEGWADYAEGDVPPFP